MAGLGREFQSALRSFFGPSTIFNTGPMTGGGAFQVTTGPCEVYSILQLFGTASTAASIDYQDASATGTGVSGVLRSWGVTTGSPWGNTMRPFQCSKGFAINFTATGAVNSALFVVAYSPLPQPFGGAG